MELEFNAFLKKKKIDPMLFKEHEPESFREYESQFLSMHPGSFTMQKLYLINILRRKYHFVPQGGKEEIVRDDKPDIIKTGANMTRTSKSVISPRMSKPVIATNKMDNEELVNKPAASKPVIRPKIQTITKVNEKEEESKNGDKPKPVLKKPFVKPVMKIRAKEEEQNNFDDSNTSKPKQAVRPIIKPKIPKKED